MPRLRKAKNVWAMPLDAACGRGGAVQAVEVTNWEVSVFSSAKGLISTARLPPGGGRGGSDNRNATSAQVDERDWLAGSQLVLGFPCPRS